MAPSVQAQSHFREPALNGYESEYSGDTTSTEGYFKQKPHKNVPQGNYYSDSEPKSRFTAFTGQSSSGRRSRKTSSSGKELVRILLEEKADAERLQVQLEKAYGILRAESQRAVEAEKTAIETAERLKGTLRARVQAQQESARLQAELRMYKLQYENAQAQLHKANDMISQSDLERERSERALERMRRNVHELQKAEVARRALEEGRRLGREEMLRRKRMQEVADAANRRARGIDQYPTATNGETDSAEGDMTDRESNRRPRRRSIVSGRNPQNGRGVPATADSYRTMSPLPVPPPESVPVYSANQNRVPADIAYRQPVPIRGQQYNMQDAGGEFEDDPIFESRPFPDHIIVRSPVPSNASADTRSVDNATPRPATIYSQGGRPNQMSAYPPGQGPIHPYGSDVNAIPAGRPYPSDSPEFPPRPDSRLAMDGPDFGMNNMSSMGDSLPQPEEIVPLPAANQGYGMSRPPSVPLTSAANFAFSRQRGTRPPSVSSSSTNSSPVTETQSVIRPSRLMQKLRRSKNGWSSESSVPGITIEPPSRPESVDSHATTTTYPSHLTPDPSMTIYGRQPNSNSPVIPIPRSPLGFQSYGQQQQPGRGNPPARPASRTGFSYGGMAPSSPAASIAAPQGPLGPPGMTPMPGAPPAMPIPSAGLATPGPEHAPMPSYVDASLPRRSTSKTPIPQSHRRTTSDIPGIPRPGSAADYFGGMHHTQRQGHGQGHRRAPAGDANAFYDPDTDPEGASTASGGSTGPPIHSRRGSVSYANMTIQQAPLNNLNGTRPSSRASVDSLGLGGSAAALMRRSGAMQGNGSRPQTQYSNIGPTSAPASRSSRPASRMSSGHTPYHRPSGLYDS